VRSQEIWLGADLVYILYTFAYFTVMRQGKVQVFARASDDVSTLRSLNLYRVDRRRWKKLTHSGHADVTRYGVNCVNNALKEGTVVEVLLLNLSQLLPAFKLGCSADHWVLLL
jgi:hypothetical protein